MRRFLAPRLRLLSQSGRPGRFFGIEVTHVKQSQAAVRYRRGFGKQQCGKCAMYEKSDPAAQFGSCTAVTGQITPFGLCNIWRGLINPFGPVPPHEKIPLLHERIRRLHAKG